MKCNVGPIDRLLRIIVGLAIAVLGVIFDSWYGIIGIVPLATGLFAWCPLYVPFKLSTLKKKNKKWISFSAKQSFIKLSVY